MSRSAARVSTRDAVLTGAAITAGVATIAAANGGYYATAWSWATLVLVWISAVALARFEVRFTGLQFVVCGALAAFAGWMVLPTVWSGESSQAVPEMERALVYGAGALAFFLVLRRRFVRYGLGGLLAGIAVISSYALATRVFPERLGVFDSVASYRLSEPIGYWNALGIFEVLGILLALGFVAHARSAVGRALAGGSLVVLLPTLYFTYSRGAWIALGFALAAAIALDRQRLRLVTAMLAVCPWPAVAVWLASDSSGLTTQRAPLAAASRDGHRLAVVILLLALGAAGTAFLFGLFAARVDVWRPARIAYAAALVLVVAIALITVFARYGSPPTLARKAYDSFVAPPPRITGDLNARLFTLSSRGRYQQWKVAWHMYREDPWLGGGAGTYEQYWHRHRPVPGKVKDAHSLYLETLAEVGPPGLALLLLALGVPLVAAVKARRHPLVPAACGAYIAYLVHAGVDWDWEMPAVTLAALFCGGAILVAARSGRERPIGARTRAGLLAATLAVGAFAFVGLIGNSALARSADALADSDYAKAESQAHKAARWAPWSSKPWQLLGQTEIARGDRPAARAAFRKAITKDPDNWELWIGLSSVTDGKAGSRALAEAIRLNPFLGPGPKG